MRNSYIDIIISAVPIIYVYLFQNHKYLLVGVADRLGGVTLGQGDLVTRNQLLMTFLMLGLGTSDLVLFLDLLAKLSVLRLQFEYFDRWSNKIKTRIYLMSNTAISASHSIDQITINSREKSLIRNKVVCIESDSALCLSLVNSPA